MTSRSSSLSEMGWPDHRPDIFPAEITRPCSARHPLQLGLAFQMPRFAAASRRFHLIQISPSSRFAARLLPGDPGVLDLGAVDVDVAHGRGDPGVSEDLLDRDQVHPVQVELGGAEVPQHVRRQLSRPARADAGRRRRPGRRAGRRRRPGAADPSVFLRSEGNSGAPGRVWSSSNWPHTSSMNQRSVRSAPLISGTIRSRGPDPRAPLPWRTWSLPNRPSSHLMSSRSSWHASFTRSPTCGHQPRGGVVPGGRARTCGTSPAPRAHPAEQWPRSPPRSAGSAARVLAAARPVHLVDRALDDPPGHRVDLDLVPQLQEHEVRRQRLRAAPAGCRSATPRSTCPKYASASAGSISHSGRPNQAPHLLQVPDIAADRAVRQPGRGPREHEPGQHVGLERR